MELTNKQMQGLKIAIQRYKDKEPFTVIAGYAGTGKSTLVRFIIDALDLTPDDVAYIAYTGKAAQVLRSKGCPDAMTAHRLLYKFIQKYDGTFIRIPKEELTVSRNGIIVVDEVSMLPKEMWDLLLSHHIYVIACGDPAQLPAIGEAADVLNHPHIFLDEIMRQAQESEIIRLTMDIREGKPIKPFKGKEINIVRHNELVEGMYHWADQIICAKNETRNSINHQFRKYLWQNPDIPTIPLVGDRIICLRNNWDICNDLGDAIVNGTTGTILSLQTRPNLIIDTECHITMAPDGYEEDDLYTNFIDVSMDWKLITTGEPLVNKDNFRKIPKDLRPNQFDYGYAITCHKSQGSEWGKVLVVEEGFPWEKEEKKRWLYTAATRASEKLTLVLKD